MKLERLFRISYEKQIAYFIMLLLVFYGFTEIISLSFARRMEYKWRLTKKAEFSIVAESVLKILDRPAEEARKRFLLFTERQFISRIAVFDENGQPILDTSPYTEKILIPKKEENTFLRTERKQGSIVASYWYRLPEEKGKTRYLVLFSPGEEIPFLLLLLRTNSYIKLFGTFVALILGIYFVIFVLSPFKKMGSIAMEIKDKEVSSVDEIVSTFNDTIRELSRMYAKEKKKVRRMEREISLKEHLASLGEMSAGIAHEFKNALGSIIGFTKLALKGKGEEKYMLKVRDEAESLNKVVNGFLFFAKPQNLEKSDVDLKEILNVLLAGSPENITIKNEMNEGRHFIQGDKHLLKMAFGNILKNAYESMAEGGTIVISSSFHPREGLLRIRIEDQGTGISSKIRKEVFTPFFSTKASGVGLGLSIVYKVITLHNGKVNIRSSRKGTTVEVEIPVKDE